MSISGSGVSTGQYNNAEYIETSVSTTDATVTTIASIAIPQSRTLLIQGLVVARRTGGSAGSAGDAAAYNLNACYKNPSGTAVEVGETSIASMEDQAAWACTFTASGSNALIQVTGAVNNNILWAIKYRSYSA